MRIEAALPLYGHELDERTDPFAAGLGFAVSLDKGDEPEGPQVPTFIGQQALNKINVNGPGKRLVGIRLEGKRTPRQGMAVYVADDVKGSVTSGCLSPTLGDPIAMVYIDPDCCAVGDDVSVAIGSRRTAGQVVPLPFYKRSP